MTPSNFKTVGHFFNGFYKSFTERDDCLLSKNPPGILLFPLSIRPSVTFYFLKLLLHLINQQTDLLEFDLGCHVIL